MKTYRIYQLPVEHKAKFMGLEFVTENNIMPKLEDYKMVWQGEVEDDAELDDIYTKFNVGKKPEDFTGHSLSISDIVEVDGKYFYCDDYGWEEVIDLFPVPTLIEGEEYECVKDYIMEDGTIDYKAGKTYKVLDGYGHLGTDEGGSELHKMSEERDFSIYFKKVEPKKIYIITANGVTFNLYYNTREEAQAKAEKLNDEYYMRKVWNVEEVIDADYCKRLAEKDCQKAEEKALDLEENGTRCSGETPEMKIRLAEARWMKQYQELMNKYPGALLLFRCGDFYEAYYGDAIAAAKFLGITLTHRIGFENEKGHEMAGFPHHALDIYLPKLIRAGFRVVILDDIAA